MFLLILMGTVAFFFVGYRIEYGGMTEEEKKERLERFEKYGM